MEGSSSTSRFKKSFLYKLLHRKKGSSRTSVRANLEVAIDNEIGTKEAIVGMIGASKATLPMNHSTNVEALIQISSSNCCGSSQVQTATESSSVSRLSQITTSSDSMKMARELFFEPVSSKSESDSGYPDEEKKQDCDGNSQEETYIRISSHTFRQLQNEITFLRGLLANLHQLFCSENEIKPHSEEVTDEAHFSYIRQLPCTQVKVQPDPEN